MCVRVCLCAPCGALCSRKDAAKMEPCSPSLRDCATSSAVHRGNAKRRRVHPEESRTPGTAVAHSSPSTVLQAPSHSSDALLSEEVRCSRTEEYSSDEKQLNEFLKLHPMLCMGASIRGRRTIMHTQAHTHTRTPITAYKQTNSKMVFAWTLLHVHTCAHAQNRRVRAPCSLWLGSWKVQR